MKLLRSGFDESVTGVKLNDAQDKMTWALEKSGKYTTKSMYRFLLHRGVVNTRMRRLWKNKMPMKVKVFMWLASQNRIQSGELLGVGGEEEVGRETRDVGFVG